MRSIKCLLTIQCLVLSMTAVADRDLILDVDADGLLQGARNVLVEGEYYDVRFTLGSCVSLFSGCDEPQDFPFPNSSYAALASLMETVFVDVPGVGNFDSDPRLTNGCNIDYPAAGAECLILLPDNGDGEYMYFTPMLINRGGIEDNDATGSFLPISADFPSGQYTEHNALIWSTWSVSLTDSDEDGITNSHDNCTLVANSDQRDSNNDGFGNLCDPDINNV